MRIGSIYAIVLRQYYLMRGSFSRVLPLFAWAAIDIILWGFITKYLDTISLAGLDLAASLLGAVLLWDFFIRVMQGITTAFFEDVWSRNFLNLFSTPLTIPEYLVGLIATSIITSIIGLAVMLLIAGLVFGLSFMGMGISIIAYLIILFLFGIALGILGCTIVLRLGPSAEWFIWPIPAFLSPFAAVFYPLSTLPHWMQVISLGLPPSYVFEGLRSVISGGSVLYFPLLVGFALSLLYIFLAGALFYWVYRKAVKSGLLARYSAENVS